MKVILLGSYRAEIVNTLISCGDKCTNIEDKITLESEIIQGVDFLVSYGYRHILKKDILDKFPNRAINIHISLLPWNRGADPNLWSFLENTPKGVTIHYIDYGIDTGDILAQQEVYFSGEETLRTSYNKLSRVAEKLFEKYWIDIREGRIQPKTQPIGGSYHRSQEKSKYEKLLTQGWDTPVNKLMGQVLAKETLHATTKHSNR